MATETDDGVTSRLAAFLQDTLTPEQMKAMAAILAGKDVQAAEMPMAADARIRQLAAQERLRQAEADEAQIAQRFPGIGRFV